jgi:hypothetical protein
MHEHLESVANAIIAFKQLKTMYLNRALNCDDLTECETLLAKAEVWGRLELDSQLAFIREQKEEQ